MKNLCVVFSIAITFAIGSCTQSDVEADGFPYTSAEEAIAVWKKEARENPVTVQHATIEEYNAVMREFGLAEITEEDVQKAKLTTRSICADPDCEAISYLGDWNLNGTLSTLDIALAVQWMQNNYEGVVAQSEPIWVHRFAATSYFNCLNEQFEINNLNDSEGTVRQWILLNICDD